MTDQGYASTILAESMSPNGNLAAIVEATAECVHFYLSGEPETGFGVHSVWVRNLKPATVNFDADAMRRGEPPMMPKAMCAHPGGAAPLDRAKLRVVWFEEGDAAALLESDEILAVIPAWSGHDHFYGYARDCTEPSPLAWPLNGATAMFERVARAEEFWRSWAPGQAQWPTIQDVFLREYERAFGRHQRYFGIDGGNWPPKAIASFETDAAVVLLTLGVSIRPMPKVEMAVEDPQPHRRMELGVAIDKKLASDEVVRNVASYMSAQSNLPWRLYTWLGDGHTVQCEPCPVGGGDFAAMLLLKDPPGAPAIAMPAYRGDPVNLLWMTPITAAEWTAAQEQSSGEVLRRLAEQGRPWPHRQRVSVI
jgi:hypothetical protein